jgi:hypothetical protein
MAVGADFVQDPLRPWWRWHDIRAAVAADLGLVDLGIISFFHVVIRDIEGSGIN